MSSSSKEARRRSRKPSMETTVERIVIMPATVGRWRKNLQPFSVLRSFEQAQVSPMRSVRLRSIGSASDFDMCLVDEFVHRLAGPAIDRLVQRQPPVIGG